MKAGDALPAESVGPLTRTDFVRYAGAGGDLNPIHHDEPFAVAAGFPSVFGMGLLHAGILATRVARWAGPGRLRTYRVRFTARVWPGDVLTLAGAVTAVQDGLATAELTVTRQDGEIALRATATFAA